MGEKNKLTVGIILNFSSSWMGGIIYILNVVKVLNWLDKEDKPIVKLFYKKDLKRFVDEITYPYLETIEWEFPPVLTGYLKSWLSGKNQFIEPILNNHNLDTLFPVLDLPVKTKSNTKIVSWYADLQHKYYPEFFSFRKLLERKARIQLILKNTDHLVVSSESVAGDFKNFFRLRQDMPLSIFHFASVIDDFDFSGIKELRKKYLLPEHYFLVSNQFHKHKNHQILFEALALLKNVKTEKQLFLALTGRLPANDQSPHIMKLQQIIRDQNLSDQVRFLGVLSRQEQLTLMRHAQAVIQPSLFEGWSTVIEDAISLQTPVIASSIPVNIEQLKEQGTYFDPEKPKELASILTQFSVRSDLDKQIYESYNIHIRKAAKVLIQVLY